MRFRSTRLPLALAVSTIFVGAAHAGFYYDNDPVNFGSYTFSPLTNTPTERTISGSCTNSINADSIHVDGFGFFISTAYLRRIGATTGVALAWNDGSQRFEGTLDGGANVWVTVDSFVGGTGTSYALSDLHLNRDGTGTPTIVSSLWGATYTMPLTSHVPLLALGGANPSSLIPTYGATMTFHADQAVLTNYEVNFQYYLEGYNPVPEPASLSALGLGSLVVLRRRRRS